MKLEGWVVIVVASSLALGAGRAAADTGARGHWEAGVGLGLGAVRVDDPGLPTANSGASVGLVASIGYVGRAGVGLILDASLWRNSPDECDGDASCFNHRAERIGVGSAALRWQAHRAVYVQAGLGVAVTRAPANAEAEQWWSPVGTAAIGWRRPVPDAIIGLELRTSVLRNDTTWVTSAVAILSVGRAW